MTYTKYPKVVCPFCQHPQVVYRSGIFANHYTRTWHQINKQGAKATICPGSRQPAEFLVNKAKELTAKGIDKS